MSRGSSKQSIVVALMACALAACGGGGGGGGGPPPPPPLPTVGGSVSGLVGSVTLQNAGGAPLTVTANGTFTFPGTVAAGASYAVTVATQPELQECTVTNGSGTASANITNITISCADTTPTLSLTLPAIKTFRLAWTAVEGIAHYKLFEDPTGNSEDFTQLGADIDASTTSVDHIVPLHLRVNARYKVQACTAARCVNSKEVIASSPLAEAVGYFKAELPAEGDQFGTSVALSADGTTLAVGVPFEDSNARDSGAVYVFVRSGAEPGWVQQRHIKVSTPLAQDFFGFSVALDSSGSTLAVGAASRAARTGAVYVFERSDSDWTEKQVLTASTPRQGVSFGISLALSDDGQLAIGASGDNCPGNPVLSSGAVHVFVKEAVFDTFIWQEKQCLQAMNADIDDQFGESVALSRDGTTLVVGASREDSGATGPNGNEGNDPAAANSGAVYVFTQVAGLWAQQAYIKASNTGQSDNFGEKLALSADGSTLAVGAIGEDSAATGIDRDQGDDTLSNAGAAYVFVRTGNEWEQQAYVKASDTAVRINTSGNRLGDRFGISIALSDDGSILAVGAQVEDSNAVGIGGDDSDNSAEAAGAVYVFERASGVWAQRAYVKASNTSSDSAFGFAVALSADGATLAAGAVIEDGGATGVNGDQDSPPIFDSGAVYLY